MKSVKTHFQNMFPLWIIPVFLVLSVLTVWLRLSIVQITYEINEVNRTLLKTRIAREKLEVEVAQLRSPRRLERIAKKKLNLLPPRSDQVIHFKGAMK